jgi:hypothetical protein
MENSIKFKLTVATEIVFYLGARFFCDLIIDGLILLIGKTAFFYAACAFVIAQALFAQNEHPKQVQ